MYELVHKVTIQWRKELENGILCEIQRKATENGITHEYVLNESEIMGALKKQVPEDVSRVWYKTYCPCCHQSLESFVNASYCPNCGQALDWSAGNV